MFNNLPVQNRDRRGFTLLEILVSASLFSIVMLTATGLFVATTRSQKKVQSLSKVQGDARFVVETLAQAVRIDGIDYTTMTEMPAQLSSNGVKLVTRDSLGTRSFFRVFVSGTLGGSPRNVIGVCTRTVTEDTSNPTKCVPSGPASTTGYANVTPTDINVTALNVFVSPGSDPFLPAPDATSDCAAAAGADTGFDDATGTCKCTGINVATACFPDQTCSSSSTAIGACRNANSQPRATIVISSNGGSQNTAEQTSVTFQTTISSRVYER